MYRFFFVGQFLIKVKFLDIFVYCTIYLFPWVVLGPVIDVAPLSDSVMLVNGHTSM